MSEKSDLSQHEFVLDVSRNRFNETCFTKDEFVTNRRAFDKITLQ